MTAAALPGAGRHACLRPDADMIVRHENLGMQSFRAEAMAF
jgi:hypothetical protein